MKNVIKEICIAILLCVAALLIFAIAFYDYVPINKVVPSKVAYSVPEEVKSELAEDLTIKETQPQKITYSVSAEDLQQYQSATVYQPGNPNPFHAVTTPNENYVISGTGETTTTAGGGTVSNNGIQYYYQNSGSSLK